MSFSPNYLKHPSVLQNVGMTRTDPVMHNGVEIIPLQFLKAALPDPRDLGKTTRENLHRQRHHRNQRDGQFAVHLQHLRP